MSVFGLVLFAATCGAAWFSGYMFRGWRDKTDLPSIRAAREEQDLEYLVGVTTFTTIREGGLPIQYYLDDKHVSPDEYQRALADFLDPVDVGQA